jgi:hypothetical protein
VAKEELWNRWRCAFPVKPSGSQLNERSRETLGFETRAERDLMLVLHRPVEPTAQSGHRDRDAGIMPCFQKSDPRACDRTPPHLGQGPSRLLARWDGK